jgi:protease I
MKKALIITGQGVQDQEFIYPFHRLQEAEFDLTVLTANDGPCTGYFGTKISPTPGLMSEMRFLDSVHYHAPKWSLVVLPGGVKAMEHMRLNKDLISFISRFHHSGGVVASICSAAQLLISAGLVKGREISGYYSMADDIVNAGGTFVDAPAVVCDRVVTSPHYKHLGPWMGAVLKEVG